MAIVRVLNVALLAAFGAAAVLASSAVAQIPDVPGWELTWHDEFDGTQLDTTKWEAMNRKDSFNNERQYYLPSQVTVADGNLKITATNQPLDGKPYRSGLITSKDLYGPGRYEARLDLPTTQGMWPAFWMNANQAQWPLGGEIDILENRGSQPNLTSSAYHWQKDPGPCCNQHQYVFHEYTATDENDQPVNFHTGFHTYAVEWDDTLLKFYVDGNLHFTVPESGQLPIVETAKNIILNLAVGGDFGGNPNGSTVFPQTMQVDYVRVWKRQTGLQGDYNNDGFVDALDYTVWRNSDGESAIDLPADGSGNGTVGSEDFDIWKQNYQGEAPPVGSGGTSETVPEPTSAVPISLGILLACGRRGLYGAAFSRIA